MQPIVPIDVPLDGGMQDGLELDVAIVGAGASGLYTGWRLATAGAPVAAHVFELSDRIAGRLQTVELPGMTIPAEMGGMRYLDAHVIVAALIEQQFAGVLDWIPFEMGDPASHFFYLRQQRFRADAWSVAQGQGEQFPVPYALDPDDLGFSGDQLFNKVVYDVLMADPWFAGSEYACQVAKPGALRVHVRAHRAGLERHQAAAGVQVPRPLRRDARQRPGLLEPAQGPGEPGRLQLPGRRRRLLLQHAELERGRGVSVHGRRLLGREHGLQDDRRG